MELHEFEILERGIDGSGPILANFQGGQEPILSIDEERFVQRLWAEDTYDGRLFQYVRHQRNQGGLAIELDATTYRAS